MSIPYSFEIVAVDEAAKCMEVVYTADGYPTMHIGARLPFEGESLEAVVDMYSPVAHWIALSTPVVVPAVGTTGQVTPVAAAPIEPAPVAETVYTVGADTVVQNV